MIVLRYPGYYSYLDPGLIHTERGFADAALIVASDSTIQAGLPFTSDGLDDLAASALEIFLRSGVEYVGVNVALSVYQAIGRRMPQDTFTWDTTGLEAIVSLWPDPSPLERVQTSPEQRETPSEKPLRLPPADRSPELPRISPKPVERLPVSPVEGVAEEPEEFLEPGEVVPDIVIPEIARPPWVSPDVPRRPPSEPPTRLGVPVEVDVPPVVEAEPERPPTASEVAEEIADKIGQLEGLDYGEIRKIVQEGVDRLSERFRDPGLVGEVTIMDEFDMSEGEVRTRLIREMRVMKEAAFESVKGMRIEDRTFDYPVTLPGR